MNSFPERPRYKLGKILKSLHDQPSNAICHILDNLDGTYSIMYHIVCEHCDYCDSQGDCRDIFSIERIVPFKEDPYIINRRLEEEAWRENEKNSN